MNNATTKSITVHRVTCRYSSARTSKSTNNRRPTRSTKKTQLAGQRQPSLQNKLSTLTTGAKSQVTTKIQLYRGTNLPGRTGLAIVIGRLHTHSHAAGPEAGSIFVGIAPCSNNVRFTAGVGDLHFVFEATHQCNPITNPRQTALTWALPLVYGPSARLIPASSGAATITDTTLKMCSHE